MITVNTFPPQRLSYSAKNKAWRRKCVDWADKRSFTNYSPVRNSIIHKKINYDLVDGKIHMSDLQLIVNPDNLEASFIPEKIQHYPIINTKLDLLRGEEYNRIFDYRVIITNPNSISEIENAKRDAVMADLQELISNMEQSEEEYQQALNKLNDFYSYEWQDHREIRANELIKHYSKEQNFKLKFNEGYMDAMTVGEEIYQCDIEGGEPVLKKLNPLKVSVFKSGFSNKIEDADLIIIEDYMSVGKVIDAYYDVLSPADVKKLDKEIDQSKAPVDEMDNIDERYGFVHKSIVGDGIFEGDIENAEASFLFGENLTNSLPYDTLGNVRVLKVFWKSLRKIKKVKSYNPNTGEEEYNIYNEDYIVNKDLGEEEEILYINQAWEGTKIGENIYVNIRPRVIQYNTLANPSRCHFGIVGSIYNNNEGKPFSLVDRMKKYNYLYDVIHDRLNKLIAKNWGRIVTLDLAKVPAGWSIDKWLYFAKTNAIAVVDSFKEGNIGAATGKLAGGLNNNSSGVIDAELGNSIQSLVSMLEFIKMEMAEVTGISKQREGQISNRETVGGVERATLQSSHITEWLFAIHEDVKKRAIECFLETAKIACQGGNLKFQYLLSDNSMRIMDIDGDVFAESDYGLIVDTSKGSQELSQKLESLAQAALQNQSIRFSTMMKLFNSISLAEKQRLVEKDEKEMQEIAQQNQQQQMQMQQEQTQLTLQQKQAEMELEDSLNQRDNETKLLIATMQQSNTTDDGVIEPEYSQEAKDKLYEQIREFDAKMSLDRDKLEFEKKKHSKELELKDKISQRQSKRTTSK
jgi:hypothetical protein